MTSEEIKERFEAMRSLVPDWAGEKSVPPSERALNTASAFLEMLPGRYRGELTDVTPTPYGTISLDWEQGGDLVSTEAGDALLAFFTDFNVHFEDNANLHFELEDGLPEQLLTALSVLFGK